VSDIARRVYVEVGEGRRVGFGGPACLSLFALRCLEDEHMVPLWRRRLTLWVAALGRRNATGARAAVICHLLYSLVYYTTVY
jgi:hypothetical protein